MQETWVQSLGQEDPLQKEMATHSSILAWETPWTVEPEGLQSTGWQESDMTDHTHTHSVILCNHCAFINTKKLTLIHYYQLNFI